ncbi:MULTISPECIES: DUF2339 domain-containing protein [Exiguobacterium]|uniref:DUF2339 domain-containing protein n=1 Tax=Exiguobacterium TaxID=33986 RepID=UPI000478D686|nr:MULTISPECIES: DUF2339 domain-containing protein [Exiguobacterium]MCT4780649.1 DUF2339 domain-containing protein [Exiguobacterium soli]
MDETRLEQLEQEVERLKARLDQLEQRSAAVPEPASSVTRPKVRPAFVKKGRSTAVQPKRTRDEWEQLLATVWLPRIGAIFAAIGAIFLFSYASLAGWISPAVRVGSGLVIGLLVMALGEFQYEKKRRELGIGLVATGTIVSLSALFAGMALYAFYPPLLAFFLELIVLAVAYGLMLWMRSSALLILVSITGFLLPFLQLSDEPDVFLFLVYEVVLFTALFVAVVRLKAVKAYPFSAGMLFLALLFSCITVSVEVRPVLDEVSLVCAALIAYLGTAYVGRRLALSKNYPSWLAGLFVLISLYVVEWSFVYGLSLVFAVVAYVVANGTKDAWQNGVGHLALVFTIHQLPVAADSLSDQFRSILYALVLIGLWFVKRQQVPYQRWIGIAVYLLFILKTLADYEVDPWNGRSYAVMVFGLALATAGLVYLLVRTHQEHEWTKYWKIVLTCAAAGVFITYTLIVMELPFYANLDQTDRSTTLSVAYILLAFVLVAIGRIRTSAAWRLSGLLLLSVSALKLLLFDLSFLSLIQKAFVFIGFGIVAFIISRTYFKKRPS